MIDNHHRVGFSSLHPLKIAATYWYKDLSAVQLHEPVTNGYNGVLEEWWNSGSLAKYIRAGVNSNSAMLDAHAAIVDYERQRYRGNNPQYWADKALIDATGIMTCFLVLTLVFAIPPATLGATLSANPCPHLVANNMLIRSPPRLPWIL